MEVLKWNVQGVPYTMLRFRTAGISFVLKLESRYFHNIVSYIYRFYVLKNHVDMCIITASTATITKNEKTKCVHFALRFKLNARNWNAKVYDG